MFIANLKMFFVVVFVGSPNFVSARTHSLNIDHSNWPPATPHRAPPHTVRASTDSNKIIFNFQLPPPPPPRHKQLWAKSLTYIRFFFVYYNLFLTHTNITILYIFILFGSICVCCILFKTVLVQAFQYICCIYIFYYIDNKTLKNCVRNLEVDFVVCIFSFRILLRLFFFFLAPSRFFDRKSLM